LPNKVATDIGVGIAKALPNKVATDIVIAAAGRVVKEG
jgi:hypothetical protein